MILSKPVRLDRQVYSLISSTIPAKFSNCWNWRSIAGIAVNFWILANTRFVVTKDTMEEIAYWKWKWKWKLMLTFRTDML